ncbi:2-keto-4-pentenoate hydratase [Martelella lutilitoris]|uniref:2-keto-4-pentenoate hydratase n=1 Tax=Martelella lutilitoris TaxID=2583532 RepID=A0A5C4JUY8_9HYPH|nr:fumarylacetoacetate hydrolase family protein [Martelella lutilitoris]TNB49248.1 2-keto-4-pentenoate hydratase [Martelella lutilitoris]
MSEENIENVAAAFVEARRAATPLEAFPGDLPETLEEAYRVQDRALQLDGRPVAGWKVAGVHPDLQQTLGATRLVGPIFADNVHHRPEGGVAEAAVFDGGFAALEAEFAAVFAKDLEPAEDGFSNAVILSALSGLHAGAEIASSPLPSLNALGPCAVVSDHGNNAGAIVGPVIADWEELDLEAMTSRMFVDGALAGEGSAAKPAGGPFESIRQLAEILLRRGRKIRKGDIVLTGMTTGIHAVTPGATARVEFAGAAVFEIAVKAAKPR